MNSDSFDSEHYGDCELVAKRSHSNETRGDCAAPQDHHQRPRRKVEEVDDRGLRSVKWTPANHEQKHFELVRIKTGSNTNSLRMK